MAISHHLSSLETPKRAHNTFRAAVVLLLAAAAAALYGVYLGGLYPTWQLPVVVGALSLFSVVLVVVIRRSRDPLWADRAGLLMISMMQITAVVISAMLTGLGVALGLATLLATVAIATQILPPRWIDRSLLGGVVSGVTAGALDLLQPSFQLFIPQAQAFTPVIVAGTLLAFGLVLVRQYRIYSLSSKLIVAFLGVAMLAIGLVTFFADRSTREALIQDVGADLKSLADAKALIVGESLSKQAELLESLGLSKLIQDAVEQVNSAYPADEAAARAEMLRLDQRWQVVSDDDVLIRSRLDNPTASELVEYAGRFENNVEVFVTDRFGGLVAATNRTSDYYQADEAWWQAAYNNGEGGIFIGQPEYDESSRTFASIIAVPLYGHGTATVIGVLRTTYDVRALLELLQPLTMSDPRETDVLIPPGSGRELSGFLGGSSIEPLSENMLVALRAGAAARYSEIMYEGSVRLAGQSAVKSPDPDKSQVISELGWIVVVHEDRQVGMAHVEGQARGILLIAVVIAGLVTVGAMGLSHQLATPIRRLTDAAARVSAGDLTIHAQVETGDEVGVLATTFNGMTERLHALVDTLESQVEARTAQLRASAEVGRAAASILDTGQLMREVVSLIAARFNFYYAAIFMVDEAGKYAVLREATGEAGQALKARGHKLEVGGKSMVGAAISTRRPRIALDVGEEAVRFANPLLPETRSEIALPLIVGDRVLGALDAQSTQEAAFDESSAATLQTMADQIAVALANAEQFRRGDAQARIQSSLLAVALELSGELTRDELFDRIVRRATELFDAEGAAIWLTVGEEEIELVASLNISLAPTASRRLAKGEGLSGRVLANKRAMRASDFAAQVGEAESFVGVPVQAALAVPMLWQGRISGVLLITRAQPEYPFGVGEEHIAQLLAAQAAAALAGTELRDQQRRTLEELDAANRRLTGEAWAEVFRRRPEHVRQAGYTRSGYQPVDPSWLPEVELAIAAKKSVAWSRRAEQTVSSPFQATLAAPVVLRGEIIGAVQVGETEQARSWDAEDLSFIQAVADQVAQAVENARLIEETQSTARREKTLAEATDKIRRKSDMESILQTAAEELARQLNASRVAVHLRVDDDPSDDSGRSDNGHAG